MIREFIKSVLDYQKRFVKKNNFFEKVLETEQLLQHKKILFHM